VGAALSDVVRSSGDLGKGRSDAFSLLTAGIAMELRQVGLKTVLVESFFMTA
jgi:hypothetical protein